MIVLHSLFLRSPSPNISIMGKWKGTDSCRIIVWRELVTVLMFTSISVHLSILTVQLDCQGHYWTRVSILWEGEIKYMWSRIMIMVSSVD